MKTTFAILLCGLLTVQPLLAQTTSDPPVTKKPSPELLWCLVFVGCAAAGGCIAIWAACNTGRCAGDHKLVLDADQYDDNWRPIATNIVYVSTNRVEVFREEIRHLGLGWRYRIRDVPMSYLTE